MRKTIFGLGAFLLAAAMVSSCGDSNEKKTPSVSKNAAGVAARTGVVPNYRFINFDSICSKYNLAIDFTEQMMRLQNNYDSEIKRQSNSISSRERSLQQKYENLANSRVPLPSEQEAFQKEYEMYQNMQMQAQQSVSKLQLEIEKTAAENLNTIMDSLQNFLGDYAAAHGYDAVLFSSNAPYYNPSLDVTDEVVEGLNARYNKIKK